MEKTLKLLLIFLFTAPCYGDYTGGQQANSRYFKAVSVIHFNEGTGVTGREEVTGSSVAHVNAAWVTGRWGYANNYDGASAYSEITNSASINLNNATISFWFKLDTDPRCPLINKDDKYGAATDVFCIGFGDVWGYGIPSAPSGLLNFSIRDNGGGINRVMNSIGRDKVGGLNNAAGALTFGDNKWHNAVFQFRAGVAPFVDSIRVIIDGGGRFGNIGYSNTITGDVSEPTPTANIRIGFSAYNNGGYFDGILDDFVIYSEILTDGELNYLYKQGATAHED